MGTRDMNHIICYTGGTCGDLISAMIDSTDVEIKDRIIVHAESRQRLKKPHTFADDQEKTQYLDSIFQTYKSVPSHDLNFHTGNQHKFITITVQKFATAVWAAERFKLVHRPHVWQEMTKACGADSVEDYAQILIDYSRMVVQYTDRVLELERIVEGHGIDDLKQYVETDLDQDLYTRWLNRQ
jgi:hypothetical protein